MIEIVMAVAVVCGAAPQEESADAQARKLLDGMKAADARVRWAGLRDLRNLGARPYRKEIAAYLQDEEPQVRRWAALALADLGAKEYTPKIAEMLDDKGREVAQTAVEALGKLGATEFTERIVALLDEKDFMIRCAALRALANLGATKCVERIAALAKLGEPSDGDRNLQVNSGPVRCEALWALAVLGAKDRVELIAWYLRDADDRIRGTAAMSLARLGAKQYAKDISQRLTFGERDAVELMRALGELGASEFAKQIAAFLKAGDSYYRYVALQVLGRMKSRDVLDDIKSMLSDGDESVRSQAVAALAAAGGEAREEVLKALDDPSPYVQTEALRALDRIGTGADGEKIARLLSSKAPGVRAAAAWSLARLGLRDQAKAIAALLSDGYPVVRGYAVRGLKLLDAREFAPEVKKLAADEWMGAFFDEDKQTYSPIVVGDVARETLQSWGAGDPAK